MLTSGVHRQVLVDAGPSRHRLEEITLHAAGFQPAVEASPDTPELLLLVLMLAGTSRWEHPGPPCLVAATEVAVFAAEPSLRVAPAVPSRPCRLLLWWISPATLQSVRLALEQTPSGEAGSPGLLATPGRPVGPFAATPAVQSLVLALRTAPPLPQRALWFGAKLLELLVLLQPVLPASEPPPPALRGALHPGVGVVLAHLQQAFAEPLTLPTLARLAGLSPTHLSRVFAAEVGLPLNRYLRQLRLEHAARLLRTGECNVTEAALAVGYASLGQFSHAFRAHFGHSPSEVRLARAPGLGPTADPGAGAT